MPKVGDKISKDQAALLPASEYELRKLCDRLNHRFHRGPLSQRKPKAA